MGDLTWRIVAVRCLGLSWLVISPMISLPLGGKLRKESQLDHVRPTQAEKLMFSRVRFLTHSIAMLRSWKNEVVRPSAGCVLGVEVMWQAAEQNPPPPHSSAAGQKQWLGTTSKCGGQGALPRFKSEPYHLVTG